MELHGIEAALFGFLCLTNNLTLYTRIIGLIGSAHKDVNKGVACGVL